MYSKSISITTSIKEVADEPQDVVIDTSLWREFPTDPTYTWSIKHPAEHTPQGVQAEFRVSTNSDINGENGVMISMDETGFDEPTFLAFAQAREDASVCTLTKALEAVTLAGYQAYTFTNDCGDYLFKTILVLNPYTEKNVSILEVWTYPTVPEYDKKLAQTMLDTFRFKKPEEKIGSGTGEMQDSLNTYHDIVNGFTIKFPLNYTVEEDTAWPNASIILYSGGQSYDLIVQVWNSDAEYKEYYKEYGQLTNMVVKHKDDKTITLFNLNSSDQVDEIIESYKED